MLGSALQDGVGRGLRDEPVDDAAPLAPAEQECECGGRDRVGVDRGRNFSGGVVVFDDDIEGVSQWVRRRRDRDEHTGDVRERVRVHALLACLAKVREDPPTSGGETERLVSKRGPRNVEQLRETNFRHARDGRSPVSIPSLL